MNDKLKLIKKLRDLSNKPAEWIASKAVDESGDFFAQISLRECKEFVEECMALGAEQERALTDDNLTDRVPDDLNTPWTCKSCGWSMADDQVVTVHHTRKPDDTREHLDRLEGRLNHHESIWARFTKLEKRVDEHGIIQASDYRTVTWRMDDREDVVNAAFDGHRAVTEQLTQRLNHHEGRMDSFNDDHDESHKTACLEFTALNRRINSLSDATNMDLADHNVRIVALERRQKGDPDA